MFRYRSFLFAVILLMLFQGKMHAQGFGPSMNGGQRISNNQTPDSLKRRDKNEDSITIYFKYYNKNERTSKNNEVLNLLLPTLI